METSDTQSATSPAPSASAARRSGRVSKPPARYTADAPQATKRKRPTEGDDQAADDESHDEADDVSESDDGADDAADDDGDSDVEEPRRGSKKKSASQAAKSRKPAAKKPKVNGNAPTGEGVHTAQLPSRPKKTARIALAHGEASGLYADVFTSGDSSDKVATDWYHRYRADDTAAVTDLVNCILLAAGCDQQVTQDDIRDPENCSNRLADLQNVYTEEGITEYPLISKGRTTKSFRDLLVGFFRSLVNVLHDSDVLYKDSALMENIARWVASMSSSTLRPFRHTATTVALAMEVALVEVAKKLDERVTKTSQQLDAEKARKGKNKERLVAIQKNLKEAEQNRQICQEHITDFFETVFVHRYRDIDPKIRTECVEALGTWIWLLPTFFMEPEYLRYLGWMLSDISPQTRHEVLKQLARILKRDAEKLGHFIDRFRPRLVEIATRDADVGVRVAAIAVIQILKESGMLEPDEIDEIGMLVFDNELRVRRAVVDFFAGCVNDLIETKVEEMGGTDAVDELFGDDNDVDDDYFSPRRDWISIKCLGELLAAYDARIEEEFPTLPIVRLDVATETVNAAPPETRLSLAAQVLYEKIDQIRNWELLSGYLLYDHTTSTKSKSSSKRGSSGAALKSAIAPEGKEEAVLLEVLEAAVRLSLASASESDRSKRKRDGTDGVEESVVHLATIIPRLLNKYGADATTAVTVLRLEHSLPLDIFQQLRQDSTTYGRLLDEVCTQFDRHVDGAVVQEASRALLHGRKYDELEEMTNNKIAELRDTVINALRHFDKTYDLSTRGNMDVSSIDQLGNIILKISKLAGISSCVDAFDADGQVEDSTAPVIELLIRIVHRGKLDHVDETLDDLEDEAVSYAIQACNYYFMWSVRALLNLVQSSAVISSNTVLRLTTRRTAFITNLMWTLSSRGTNDDLRVFSTGALCDLHVTFASLREGVKHQPGANYPHFEPLYEPIQQALTSELIDIYNAAERAYARIIKRALKEPGHRDNAADQNPDDAAQPLSDDDEDAEAEEDEDEEGAAADAALSPLERARKQLKLERVMCELAGKMVLAILAGMLEPPQGGKIRRRLLRNQSRLGNNLKETLAYLDEGKLRERLAAHAEEEAAAAAPGRRDGGGAKKKGAPPAKGGAAAASARAATAGKGGKKTALSAERVISDDEESGSDLSEVEDIEDVEEEQQDGSDGEGDRGGGGEDDENEGGGD